jgi:hypothetical protein
MLYFRILKLALQHPDLQADLLPLLKKAQCRRHYLGPPLESGGTSIRGKGDKAAPAVRRLFGKLIQPGMKVLDYGAGKFARNADWLRERDVEVFASDPFNGKGSEGWAMGSVAVTPPPSNVKFDVGFTSFVLNVVPIYIEDDIIGLVRSRTKKSAHVTRNMDIFDMVKKALTRPGSVVLRFFEAEFAPGDPAAQAELETGEFTDETIHRFCCFGTATPQGFQRIPYLEDKGFSLMAKTTGFKIYVG